ncbi:hypothetical protein E2C01_042138 [Portunus trituberculatus]|uniref:Uncharacterized protein n=1 Tax=Portunus trituberculatus TaxID=210409 RepID=A0A5B7FTS6_PORTR|nr:hypothetical protein [Portunus trituberculatus]
MVEVSREVFVATHLRIQGGLLCREVVHFHGHALARCPTKRWLTCVMVDVTTAQKRREEVNTTSAPEGARPYCLP